MSQVIFDELLVDFQKLWVEIGTRTFDLQWHNLDGHQCDLAGNPLCGAGEILEWKGHSLENPPFDLERREVIARLALPYDRTGESFTLGTDVVTLPKDNLLADAREQFQGLSARAGAAIPAETKGKLAGCVGVLNGDPAAWWYALLFALNDEPVTFQQGNEICYRQEIAVYRPVLESMQAIELLEPGVRQSESAETDGNEDDVPDGPWGIYQWRHNGAETSDRMQRKTWKLARYLHERLGRNIPFSDLRGDDKVFEDDLTDDQAIAKQGSKAKQWFKTNKIPLNVSSSTVDRLISMERITAD
jgi:hypothetical protein